MAYDSKVYRVLIATPSDVEEERDIITNAIQNWNDLYSFSKKVVLLPLKWETHTAPDYGERPQEIINKAIVDDCDILVGCFWTRIGSPTGEEESGTIEEIKKVSESGKPVMLYFSKKGKDPSTIDLEQLRKLHEFKDSIKSRALIEEYSTSIEFRDKLSRQLEIKVREIEKNSKNNKIEVITSFVNIDDGTLKSKELTESVSVPYIDPDEINEIITRKKEYTEHRDSIQKKCATYIEQSSTYPLVFGLLNKSKINLNNFLVDIRFKENEKYFKVFSSRGQNRSVVYYTNRGYTSGEVMRKLNMLDNEGLIKNDKKICSFSFEDTSLQKDRVKIIHPYLFINLKKSTSIDFDVSIYADNLFNPLIDRCSIKFEIETKKIKFTDIIPNLDDFIRDDDDDIF